MTHHHTFLLLALYFIYFPNKATSINCSISHLHITIKIGYMINGGALTLGSLGTIGGVVTRCLLGLTTGAFQDRSKWFDIDPSPNLIIFGYKVPAQDLLKNTKKFCSRTTTGWDIGIWIFQNFENAQILDAHISAIRQARWTNEVCTESAWIVLSNAGY